MAEPVVYFWEEHGFAETGGILKEDELHGVFSLARIIFPVIGHPMAVTLS